jgi:hypothetical protein
MAAMPHRRVLSEGALRASRWRRGRRPGDSAADGTGSTLFRAGNDSASQVGPGDDGTDNCPAGDRTTCSPAWSPDVISVNVSPTSPMVTVVA